MKLPPEILSEFEKIIDDLQGFGSAKITVVLHDGKPRYVLSSERSLISGRPMSGSIDPRISFV